MELQIIQNKSLIKKQVLAKRGQPTDNVQVKSSVWLFFWTEKVTDRQR